MRIHKNDFSLSKEQFQKMVKSYHKIKNAKVCNSADLLGFVQGKHKRKYVYSTLTMGDAEIITLKKNIVPSDFLGLTYLPNSGNMGKTVIIIPHIKFFRHMAMGGTKDVKDMQRRVIVHEYLHALFCMTGLIATLQLSETVEHALIYGIDGHLAKLFTNMKLIGGK